MKIRRFLSLLLVLTMVFNVCGTTAFATEGDNIPAVEDTTVVVDNTTDETVVDDTTDETVVDDTTDETVVDDTTDETVVDDTTDETVVDDTTDETVVDDTTDETVVDDTTDETVEDDTTDETVVDDTTDETVVDDTTDETVVEDTTDETVVDDTTDETVVDDTTDETAAQIAALQAKMDALPTTVTSDDELEAIWATMDEIDPAIEALTPEQQEQLDYTNYNAAIDAAAAYYNPEFDNADVFLPPASGDWGWDGNTLYIKDGLISKQQFYVALDQLYNADDNAFKYGSCASCAAGTCLTHWGANAKEISASSSATEDAGLSHGTSYNVHNKQKGRVTYAYSNGSAKTISVKYFYEIDTAVANGSPDGAGISVDTNRVEKDGSVTITVNEVAGYTASVSSSKDGAITNLSSYTPTGSATLTVAYTSIEVTKYAVTVEENFPSYGTATLMTAAELAAGAEVRVKVEPNANTASVKYALVSVKVGDTNLTKNAAGEYVYTMGEADAKISVTYAKYELKKTNDPAGINFNAGKTAANQLVSIQQQIFNNVGVQYFVNDEKVETFAYTDIETYEHKYWYTHTLGGYVTGVRESDNYTTIGTDPANEDPENKGYYDNHYFGYTGNTEHVKLTYNGLTIEADINLTLKYTITWVVDGVTSSSDYTVNATPSYQNGANPTKADKTDEAGNVMATYTFTGWDPAIAAVTSAQTYTAQFDEVPATYTVTFVDEDGTTLETDENVEFGAMPEYNGATPTKAADAQYTYTFAGWEPAVVSVTGEAAYTAKFDATVNEYTVNFVDGDGKTVQTGEVKYGTVPSYTGETPTKTATAQFTYTFKGWDAEIVAVTGAVTYTAQFDATVNTYTVTWKNGDVVLETDEPVDYGTKPSYDGETPTKSDDETNTYTFAGWDSNNDASNLEFGEGDAYQDVIVTGNVEYVAVFTNKALHAVTVNYKDNESCTETAKYVDGAKFTVPSVDTHTLTGYHFVGWYVGETKYEVGTEVEIKSAMTFEAKWEINEYTITFVNEDGTVLQSGKVAHGVIPAYTGEELTKAATAQYTYTFAGWDPVIAAATADATYTAKFDATVNEYTVTFKNEDGTELQSGKVAYGETPAYTGETPTKDTAYGIKYTFDTWTPAIAAVTGDATYTAKYEAGLDAKDDGYIKVNKWYTEGTGLTQNSAAVLEALRANILTAAGLSTDARYVVTATVGIQSLDITATIVISDGAIEIKRVEPEWVTQVPGFELNSDTNKKAAVLALASELNKDSYPFTITESKTGMSKTVSMTVGDSREKAPLTNVTADGVLVIKKHEVPDDVYSAYVADLKKQVNYKNLENVTETNTNVTWPLPEANKEYTNVYTYSYAEDANYLANSATLTVTVKREASSADPATITVSITGGAAQITDMGGMIQQPDVATQVYSVAGDNNYTFTFTPDNGKAIDTVTVSAIYADVVSDVEIELTYVDGVASFTKILEPLKAYEVKVTTVDCAWVAETERVYNFAYGLKDANGNLIKPVNADIVDAAVAAPTAITYSDVKVEYLARKAGPVTIEIPVIQFLGQNFGPFEFDVNLDDLWLEPNTEVAESDLSKLTDEIVEDVKLAITNQDYSILTNVKGYVEKKLKDAAFGAHNFGYVADENSSTTTENIRLTYTDKNGKFVLPVFETDITIKDNRIKTRLSASIGNVVYGYSEAELIKAVGAQVIDYKNSTIVSGVTVTSNGVGKTVGIHQVTLSFAGNETYAPCETTATLNVTKATVDINYDSQIVTYGTNYNFNIAVSPYRHNNGKLANPEMIEFMIGLDVAELGYNSATAGVEGAVAFVHIRLPKSISSIPLVGEKLSAVTTLGDLIELVNSMSGVLGLDPSSMETLSQVMAVLTGLNNYMEIKVIIDSNEFKPTDVGIYIAGAVTIDANYETAYTADYLIIVPTTNEVTLDWNRVDENGVMTLPLLQQNRDEYLGAHVVEDIDLEGVAKVRYLVMGINSGDDGVLSTDIYGNIKANLWTSNAGIKSNGAYLQIAYLINWGNEIYYAKPIVRAFAVVPAVAEVVLVGSTGEHNRDLLKTFNNDKQGFSVKVYSQGELIYSDHYQDAVNKLPETARVVVYYVGVQTNGKMYASTDKPVHAGAYAAAAVYLDGNTGNVTLPENTEELVNAIVDLKEFGADAGVLVIEPSKSTITMNEQVIKPFNADGYVVANVMNIVADSVNSDQTPDTTVITASIAATGDFSANGWKAVTGEVNVDFPKWVDELLPQIAPEVVDGITFAELNDKLLNKVPEIVSKLESVVSSENIVSKLPDVSAKLEEYGLTSQMVDKLTEQLKSILNGVGEQLKKLPATVTLNFTSDYKVNAVGAYVVMGIVTDSDHYPSADAGILVIVPTVDRVYLKWNYEDTNGIFTRELLEYIDCVDMFATPYDDASCTNVFDKYPTDITYQFIGIDTNGDLVVRKADETKGHADVKALNNGAYIEMAYIELEAAGHIVISDLIARPVVLIPNAADVEFVDANENHILLRKYNGQQQVIGKDDITVSYNGKLLDVDKQYLTVYYTGVQNNGQTYKLSTEAPVHAGAYVATALYAHKDDNGSVVAIGIDAISMIVSILPSTVEVSGGTVYYDGEVHTATVEATDEHGNQINDYILISGTADITGDVAEAGFDAFTATVNVELPTWMKEALEKLEIATENVPVQEVKEFIDGHINDLTEKIPENLLTELKSILDKLSPNVTVNLVDEVDYTDVGTYLYFGIVADFDHYTSVDAGLLKIVPAEVTIKVADHGKVYGEANPEAYAYTVEMVNGKVSAEELGVVVTREEGENAGEYEYIVEYTESNNYVVTVDAGKFTITKKAATITANDKNMVAGRDMPELDATVEGVIEGDELNYTVSLESDADVTIAGEYAIVVTLLGENPNYEVTVENGTLRVTKAVAQVDETTYAAVQEAIDAAKSGDTVTIIAELVEENLVVTKDIYLAAGENTLLGSITVNDGVKLTIMSGTYNDNAAKQHVVMGCAARDNGDGTWTVVEAPIEFRAIQLSVESEVVLKLKFYIPDEVLADENGYAILREEPNAVKTEGFEAKYTMSDIVTWGKDSSGRYVFTQGIAAGEMTGDVSVEFYNGKDELIYIRDKDGSAQEVLVRTVLDFAEAAVKGNPAKEAELVRAMLTFGGYAQAYFGVDVENPAYNKLAELGLEKVDVSNPKITQELTKSDTEIGLQYASQKVNLDSRIYVRTYFTLDEGADIADYKFELTYPVGNKPVTKEVQATEQNGRYYIDAKDVPVAYWDFMYKITATKIETNETYEVGFSVLAWAQRCINNSVNRNEVTMAKAMYFYNQVANIYFDR